MSLIWRGYHRLKGVEEGVLDIPTLMTLYDLMNSGFISHLNCVVSTGKESCVYWGVGRDGSDLAVKVHYILAAQFKRRLKYVVGDPRFRRVKKGMKNLILLWVFKEFKNLQTSYRAGVPVPKPITMKRNVIVMEFIGENGVPAPLLKDCDVGEREYRRLVNLVKKLYRKAKLIHADLSEFNVFKFEEKLILFDFGSAVDVTHPLADEFLSSDLRNINAFFSRKGVKVKDLKKLLAEVKGPELRAGG